MTEGMCFNSPPAPTGEVAALRRRLVRGETLGSLQRLILASRTVENHKRKRGLTAAESRSLLARLAMPGAEQLARHLYRAHVLELLARHDHHQDLAPATDVEVLVLMLRRGGALSEQAAALATALFERVEGRSEVLCESGLLAALRPLVRQRPRPWRAIGQLIEGHLDEAHTQHAAAS